jgi:hypothetical protein
LVVVVAGVLAALLAGSALLVVALDSLTGEDNDGLGGGDGGSISFTLIAADVAPIRGPAPPFPEPVKAQVMNTLNSYLERAVVEPLRSGSEPSGLSDLFTPAAAARLGGPEGPAVAEVTGSKTKVRAQRANVSLVGLAAPNAGPEVVTAILDVVLELGSPGQLLIRTGELVLVPTPGGWMIDGYELSAQRGRAR